jgi:hypothetical protein
MAGCRIEGTIVEISMRKMTFFLLSELFGLLLAVSSGFPIGLQEQQTLISVERIWSRAHHNAFTSLVRLNGTYFVTFRESEAHVYANNGAIRVLASLDGQNWESVAYIFKKGVDLRDPKLSVTPDGRLMLLMGGAIYRGKENLRTSSLVSFSDKTGKHFSSPRHIQIDPKVRSAFDWLWRVTWHKGKAYGVLYQRKAQGQLHLLQSTDGVHFALVTTLHFPGFPNETSLTFRGDQMIALVRRDGKTDARGFIGISQPPYKKWHWKKLSERLGGPALLVLPNGKLLCGTRYYRTGFTNRTVLAKVTPDGGFSRLITLPSGGDCSYPGLLVDDSLLVVSYYSSHEEKTSIYFARLWLSDILNLTAQNRTPDPFLQSDEKGVVTLATTVPDAIIHFTLDGTPPTAQSPVYNRPLHVTKNKLLQMIAVQPGKLPSGVVAVRVGSDLYFPARKPAGKLELGLQFACVPSPVQSAKEVGHLKPVQTGTVKTPSIPTSCLTNQFGLVFRGFLNVPTDGLYTFFLRSNDGSRLWIDGEELIDNDGPHTEMEKSNSIALQAGFHAIEIRYFQAGGSYALKFFWKGPGFGKTAVPSTVFFHKK